jgi:hypothetical protein
MIIGDAMDGSGFTEIEQWQGNQATRQCHGQAWWLTGVAAGVRCGLRLLVVLGSSQRRGRGFSPGGTLGGGDHPKVVHDDKASVLVLDNDGRELQGVELTRSSSKGCGIASTSSSGSHRGPKHHGVATLCVGAVARV